jgi:hypothetical protein
MKPYFSKETQLGPLVKAHLKELGFEVWEEIGNIDIVGRIGNRLIGVELKLQCNWVVLEQAMRNRHWMHWSYVAVPSMPRHGGAAIRATYQYLGVGLLELSSNRVNTVVPAAINRKAEPGRFLKLLTPATIDKGVAGSRGNTGWTEWKMMVAKVTEYVQRHPGCKIKEVLKESGHFHYHSDSSFVQSFSTQVRKGIIKGIEFRDGPDGKKGLWIA